MNRIVFLRLSLIAAITAFIGLMVGLQWQKSQVQDKPQDDSQNQEVCDANNQWCKQNISGHQTTLRISTPQGGDIITPTPITIELKGLPETNNLRVRMSGHNMYMGQFDITLQRQADGWQASTPLPNCIPDHDMIWQIDFLPPYEGTYYFTSIEQSDEAQTQ